MQKHIRMATIAAAVLAPWLLAAPLVPRAAAVDTVTTRDAPDLADVRRLIHAEDWLGAISALNGKIDAGIQHADVYNLMGYCKRKAGDLKTAYTFYRKALEFDPDHKGALEYLGQLYVETGEVVKAREQLARLTALCPSGCEERHDLEQAIAAGKGAAAPSQ